MAEVRGIAAGASGWEARFGLLAAAVILSVIAACSKAPRDLDMMVWTHADWDPKQEQIDYDECYQHAKRAAYRKYHWRRTALSREIELPTGTMSPATIMLKLQAIGEDEKIAVLEIAEQCMGERGYKLLPINKAR